MLFKFERKTFTKNNRLFHLGILVLIISLVFFIIYVFSSDRTKKNDVKIDLRVEHIKTTKKTDKAKTDDK